MQDCDAPEHGAAHALWFRYGIVIASIVALVLTHHFVSLSIMNRGQKDEALLAASAGQRMLSQRILYRALRYSEYQSVSDRDALRRDIDNFEKNHILLLGAAVSTPAIFAIYAPGDPQGLDALTREFSRSARAVVDFSKGGPLAQDHLGTLERLGRDPLMEAQNRATIGFQTRATERIDRLRQAANMLLALSLVALVAEFFVVILPLNRWVITTMRRLSHDASFDSLTGLLNRRRFRSLLDQALAGLPQGADIVVASVDLDGFKAVNDALGRPAGDALLSTVASILASLAREVPTLAPPLVARMGGDEFVLGFSLPADGADETIQAFGAALIARLATPIPVRTDIGEEHCIIAASLGYARAQDCIASPDTLISNADIALYAARFCERGRVIAFRPELREQAERRMRMETDIRHAVLNGEFVPYYQPQINMHDGTLAGVEMLARWNHPRKGLIPPCDFVTQAEEMGLSDLIEAALILRALEDVEALRRQGIIIPKLSVNASAPTLRDTDFVDNLIAVMAMYDMPTSMVAIEVLETLLIEDEDDIAVRSIRRLSAAGFSTLIDDFGTGYSSLSAISGLTLDGLKIDRSLVSQYPRPRGEKLLRATISMGHSMGLWVTAEGIESKHGFHAMRQLGCDIAQGYYIATPLPLDALRRWIIAHVPAEFCDPALTESWAFRGSATELPRSG